MSEYLVRSGKNLQSSYKWDVYYYGQGINICAVLTINQINLLKKIICKNIRWMLEFNTEKKSNTQ